MRWPAFPAYKDSEIAWLGEIPEHWDIRKLKYIASIIFSNVDKKTEQGEKPVLLCNYVDVYNNDYITPGLEFMKATASENELDKFTLREGDVIITKDSETWDDIAVPSYVPLNIPGVLCGYHLALIRADVTQLDTEYLFRSFSSFGINYQFRVEARGITRYGLGKYWLDNSFFLLPTQDEQRAIAAFLERETAKIDTLIEKKQRLVELLHEKRAALISRAVTKGLDPNAPMKDSGISWLGEIPEHWEIKRLKYLVEGGLKNGLFKKNVFFGKGIKLVNVFDVYRKDFMLDQESLDRVEADEAEQKRYSVQSGDIFFVRSSLKLEGVGRSACAMDVKGPMVFESHIVRARPVKRMISPNFLIHFLNSIIAINRFISLANLVTMATIDQEKIKGLDVPLPPRDEQEEIMDVLNREIETMERLENFITKSITKYREYRTALISDAVMGKIDVRGEAA